MGAVLAVTTSKRHSREPRGLGIGRHQERSRGWEKGPRGRSIWGCERGAQLGVSRRAWVGLAGGAQRSGLPGVGQGKAPGLVGQGPAAVDLALPPGGRGAPGKERSPG